MIYKVFIFKVTWSEPTGKKCEIATMCLLCYFCFFLSLSLSFLYFVLKKGLKLRKFYFNCLCFSMYLCICMNATCIHIMQILFFFFPQGSVSVRYWIHFLDISQNSTLEKQTFHKIQCKKNRLFIKFNKRKTDSSQNLIREKQTLHKI